MRKRASWFATFLALLVLPVAYQNCAPMESNFDDEGATLSSESVNTNIQSAQNRCRFMGPEALSSVLRDILGLERGDVAMLNEQGEPLRSLNCKSFNQQNNGRDCFYLAEYWSELSTTSCDASTFRLVSQIYVNACRESLAEQENVIRLFPMGSADTNEIHKAFTGRSLRVDEAQILRELASAFENEEDKRVSVCAAVASSLAAINSY